MSYESLDAQVQELSTYACNFSDVHYNTTAKAVCRAWVHNDNGNPAAGWNYLQAFQYTMKALINPAAKDYKREFGSMTQSWSDMWPLNVRQKACSEVLGMWMDEFELGNLYQ